jgi:transcription initiation factor TFIIIB Brf1 subunit/transcription initiation factor TFIIB
MNRPRCECGGWCWINYEGHPVCNDCEKIDMAISHKETAPAEINVWSEFELARGPPPEESLALRNQWDCECGGTRFFNDDNLPTCVECGRADSVFVSDEPEWRGGMDDNGAVSDPSRVGAPTNLDHFSEGWNMGSIMKVKPSGSWANKRLARINFHLSMNHKDRSLFHSYAEMDRIGRDVLGLSTAVMYAAKIKYKHFSEQTLTRGAVRVGVKANCIFQACKEAGLSRTTQEIAAAFTIPVRDMARTTETFLDQNPDHQVTVTTPADLIPRFFNSITSVPEAERGRTKCRIVQKCKSLEECVALQGRTPKAVAATVMFMMLKETWGVTKQELATICEVSVPTITKLEALILKSLAT